MRGGERQGKGRVRSHRHAGGQRRACDPTSHDGGGPNLRLANRPLANAPALRAEPLSGSGARGGRLGCSELLVVELALLLIGEELERLANLLELALRRRACLALVSVGMPLSREPGPGSTYRQYTSFVSLLVHCL